MPDFPHLPLPKKARGSFNWPSGGSSTKKSETTLNNLRNRVGHGKALTAQANLILDDWTTEISEIAKLPQPGVVPIFLQLDSDLFDVESLNSFGIEVIAEDEDGYIVGASSDYFRSLKEKIYAFIKKKGQYKTKAAQLWEIISGNRWRLDYILSPELNAKWDSIDDQALLFVDVGVACSIKTPPEPKKKEGDSQKRFNLKYKQWQREVERVDRLRDQLEMKRQDDFESYIQVLGGEKVSDFVNFEDSFGCRLKMNGAALKEMVLYYQYLFDVTEYDDVTFIDIETGNEVVADVLFVPPSAEDPSVCIIDSGIQQGHKLLSSSINTQASKTYLRNSTDVSDQVGNGGHGTKVAGGVLFGRSIPKNGEHNLEVRIENAKVLNDIGSMPNYLYQPELMERVVIDFTPTRLFNLSVNSFRCCRTHRMSEWAGTIDRLMFEQDILFIVSTGNINRTNGLPTNPGIQEYINSDKPYPDYLMEDSCRIANPAQSCFALSVGSICHDEYADLDRTSFGKRHEISAFSRCGLGLWGMIKPDVVEYGGDYIKETQGQALVTEHPKVGVEVVKATTNGSSAIGSHVGTSYAAPKVTHIAAKILKNVENVSAIMVRALIAQSARLPDQCFREPTLNDIRKFGYGLPNLSRATENSSSRITLTGEGKIGAKVAQIYTLAIPDEIRRPGNDFDILIEVTLSFVSSPRLTRRKTKSYLATWLDWRSARLGESSDSFQKRVIKYLDSEDNLDNYDDGDDVVRWRIRENPQWGSVKGCKRQDSSLQKDWSIVPAYNLSEEFSIAIVGHQGWNKDIANEVSYSVAVSFEVLNAQVSLDIYSLVKIANEIQVEGEVRV